MGKGNYLRWCLETYLNAENLWGNFEKVLGYLNVSMMASTDIVDMWLDDYEAYDEDSSYADFLPQRKQQQDQLLPLQMTCQKYSDGG